MHVRYRQFWTLRVSVTSFYVIRRDAYTVSGGSVNPPCSCRARRLDTWLLKNAKFHGGFKKWIPFSHLSQILYELEKKSSLVTRALSAKSCTRDTDSLHSCTRLRLVQEMACLYHERKILPRKHSYPNLIPIITTGHSCHRNALDHTAITDFFRDNKWLLLLRKIWGLRPEYLLVI